MWNGVTSRSAESTRSVDGNGHLYTVVVIPCGGLNIVWLSLGRVVRKEVLDLVFESTSMRFRHAEYTGSTPAKCHDQETIVKENK